MLKSNRIELVPFESKYFEKFVEFRNSDDSRILKEVYINKNNYYQGNNNNNK